MTSTVGSPGIHPALSKQATMDNQVFARSWIHIISHFLLLSVLGVFYHCVLLSCTELPLLDSEGFRDLLLDFPLYWVFAIIQHADKWGRCHLHCPKGQAYGHEPTHKDLQQVCGTRTEPPSCWWFHGILCPHLTSQKMQLNILQNAKLSHLQWV